MSRKITPINWKDFEKFLFKVGCEFHGQHSDSHRKYKKPGLVRPITVPVHTKELAPFFIQTNLKTLEISKEEYLKILDSL